MTLHNGEIHRKGQNRDESYETIKFSKHLMFLDITDLSFQRSDDESASRSDRTTPTPIMSLMVDSLESRATELQDAMYLHLTNLGGNIMASSSATQIAKAINPDLNGKQTKVNRQSSVSDLTQKELDHVERAAVNVRRIKAELSTSNSSVKWSRSRADRYRVEIYKKYSMALACIVFMMIGIPLGLLIKTGGIDKVAILSIAIFLFYWITLVTGEKSADRGSLEPWIGMWIANIVIGLAAVYLLLKVGFDWKLRWPGALSKTSSIEKSN